MLRSQLIETPHSIDTLQLASSNLIFKSDNDFPNKKPANLTFTHNYIAMQKATPPTQDLPQNTESKIAIVLPTKSNFIESPQIIAQELENANKSATDIVPPQPQTLQQQQNQAAIVQTQQICNQAALDELQKRTGYPIVQENGQRKYGPPPNWTDEEPDRACEVFIGKIPRDCFEDEIIPVLERVGTIYEFRLMMEYSGYNRGYGFVMYTSRENGKKAVSELNNFEIRKGRMIGLCRSVDNCRLFVGGIPKNKKREEILEEMKKITDDVVNVIVYPSANDKSKNRGFAFVQYTNHRAAAVARRKLIPARIHLFGQPIAVDWAEPEPEVDDDVMKTVKVLYVRNLMLNTTEEFIKNEFESIKANSVERVKKLKDFAFVHFKEREDALNAMKRMNGSTLDGAQIEVTLSKPVDKTNFLRITRQAGSPTNNLITSCLDPNELNLMLGTHSLSGIPSPSNIPSFPQTVTFTDPATNIQYQIPNNPYQGLNQIPMQNIPNLQYLQSSLVSQNPLIGNIMSDQNSLINKPGSRVRMASGVRGAGGIHRSAYYNNNKGGVKRQLSGEDALHDFYAGVKPVPMLPINPMGFKYQAKLPSQILEEICLKDGIPLPIYTLHSTNGKDQEGREIGLFLYKIMIPSIYGTNQLSSNRLMRSLEDAKNDAAEFVLTQMFPQSIPELNSLEQKFNQQVYHQQAPLPNGTAVPSTPPTTQNKNAISSNDQNNIFQASASLIPTQAGAEFQMQPMVGAQYILDPTGQYLMYPTPGWQ